MGKSRLERLGLEGEERGREGRGEGRGRRGDEGGGEEAAVAVYYGQLESTQGITLQFPLLYHACPKAAQSVSRQS